MVLIYFLSTIIAHVEFNVFKRTADSDKQDIYIGGVYPLCSEFTRAEFNDKQ